MPYIFLLIFTFIFTACNSTTIANKQGSVLPVSNQETDINDLKILDEDSIVGKYTLKRGMFRNQELTEGYLVVEEIDVNNYGYYYVTIADKLSPETHTGIFYKKGGQFVQKVIEDSSESEIRQGKNKSKMSIIDNMHISQDGELLKLYINSTKKEKLIWERDIDEDEKSKPMKEALKNARYEYLKYYQEKCADCVEFCGDSAYTKVNE
ncbi:MAG: Unknown protein [uncultured Sulfurovum sp.]|uniref:Uncharacterized protein n=1 Tax=uncultured Sulfurovum sp. TaxID=269237 RepID=A0A6S6SLL1_9BACT|nr:MAG: Unknown protein [uncultured Sulfurovum sp.]